jgi:Fur family transcriptional regulator, ferric uptake regulator
MANRTTKINQLVTQLFIDAQTPLSLREVYGVVKARHTMAAYSTVYRIVTKLEKDKKLIPIDWRERGSRYEWAEKEHHHHLVCDSCGDVEDVKDELLQFNDKKIMAKTGFVVKNHSIELFGLCEPCQGRNNE